MTELAGPARRCGDARRYEIRLQGHLDARWANRLDVTVTANADGTTSLTGSPIDQAALHGLLNRIRDLGLPIVSVHLICSAIEGETP